MDERDNNGPLMSIGAVSRATSIPTNTLRTWERRYGFPEPTRSAGGQRLYPPSVVPRLRLIQRALKLGHRPKQVMTLSVDALRALMDPAPEAWVPPGQTPEVSVDRWMVAVEELDGPSFENLLDAECSSLGLMAFVTHRVGPFAQAVGDRWEHGELEVYQEHFASQRLIGFLTRQWRSMSDLSTGATVVCSTLPGERHILGLHMAACVVALHGARIVFLGDDAPEADIALAARRSNAEAVLISVSIHARTSGAAAQLEALKRHLPAGLDVVVGGGGAPDGVDGVLHLKGLDALGEWAARSVAG